MPPPNEAIIDAAIAISTTQQSYPCLQLTKLATTYGWWMMPRLGHMGDTMAHKDGRHHGSEGWMKPWLQRMDEVMAKLDG